MNYKKLSIILITILIESNSYAIPGFAKLSDKFKDIPKDVFKTYPIFFLKSSLYGSYQKVIAAQDDIALTVRLYIEKGDTTKLFDGFRAGATKILGTDLTQRTAKAYAIESYQIFIREILYAQRHGMLRGPLAQEIRRDPLYKEVAGKIATSKRNFEDIQLHDLVPNNFLLQAQSRGHAVGDAGEAMKAAFYDTMDMPVKFRNSKALSDTQRIIKSWESIY